MWKKAFSRTHSLYMQGFPDIMLVIIGLIAALFFAPIDPLKVGRFTEDYYILHGVYIIICLVLSYPFVLFFNLILDNYEKQKYKDIAKLSENRSSGVLLRNEGIKIEEVIKTKYWIEKFDDWDAHTINLISRISKVEGENFKVINRFKLTSGNIKSNLRTPLFYKKVTVLEEKLARLEKLIEKMTENG